MRNWIGNFKLFFGLFHLGVKSVGPIVLVGIIILTVMANKMEVRDVPNRKRPKKSIIKSRKIVMHLMELGVISIFFVGLIGFGSLSSIFAELSNIYHKALEVQNKSELCSG